ncbi:MAG: DUF6263 family protein [Prevotellaceae bacterium]|jgi:hypothetical protein|nr:DUF6263 family protein [Prevotellaceae bacterium]
MKKFTLKIGTLALALMFVFPAFSQITLKYNLKKGEIFKQNMTTDMGITQKVMDHEMKINMTMNVKTTYEVKDVKNENYTLEVIYKDIKMNAVIPGMGNLSFNSDTPEDVATQQDFGPMLKAVVDKPIEVVITKTGKVESVKGFEKIGEAMLASIDKNIPDAAKQQLVTQFGSQFSEEQFKTFFAQNAAYYPDKPVNIGDSWDVKLSTAASNFTIDINTKMTVKSIDGNLVTLDTKGTVSTPEGYEMDVNGMKAKTSLKGTQEGTVKIDKKTGWAMSSDIAQIFGGDIEAMGMKIPINTVTKVTMSCD